MELTSQQIKNIASSPKKYDLGEIIYLQNNVKQVRASNGIFRNEIIVKAIVEDLNDEHKVEVNLDDLRIWRYSCNCSDSETYRGACSHVIATLLYYRKNAQKRLTNVTRRTMSDVSITKMMDTYSKQDGPQFENISQLEEISLVPQMNIEHNGDLSLSFKIGGHRKYIIRNIDEMCENFISQNTAEYGKYLNLKHSINNFDKKSQRLIKCILDFYYYTKTSMLNHNYNRYNPDIKALEITLPMIDEFFDIYNGDTLSLNSAGYTKDYYTKISLNENIPQLALNISENNDGELLVNGFEFNKYTMKEGRRFIYLIGLGQMHRLSKETGNAIMPLIDGFKHKYSPLVLAKRDMGLFYANVINQVKPYINIEAEKELLEQYKPIPVEAELYLDMLSYDTISAELIMCYDDYKRNAFIRHDNTNIIPDTKRENRIISSLSQYFPNRGSSQILTLSGEDNIYNFLREAIPNLSGLMEMFMSSSFKNLTLPQKMSLSIGVSLENDWLDLSIDSNEFPLEELQKALQAYKHNKKYFRLKSGAFVDMDISGFEEMAQIADAMNLSTNELKSGSARIEKFRSLQLDSIIKNNAVMVTKRNGAFRKLIKDIGDVRDGEYTIPHQLDTILRSYQKDGFQWLKTMEHYGFCGILADDMGLGKTLQIISLMLYKKNNNQDCLTLVVCPSSLVLNWIFEIDKFALSINALAIIGNAKQRSKLIESANDFDIIITSYDLLKRDIKLYQEIVFDYHIIDEAQYIKNPRTQNAQAVKVIKSKQRFALTGTPVENRLSELWSIFDFLMPGYMYSYKKFRETLEMPIVKESSEKAISLINQMTAPFLLRRLKKDVLKELPDKIESIIEVDMDEEQNKLYAANAMLAKKQLKEQSYENVGSQKIFILSLLTRLRQICCHPKLYYDNFDASSAKLTACLELIDNIIDSGHKILLFSQFTSMMAIIRQELDSKGIKHYNLQGSTPKEERMRLCEAFNEDDTPVFLISLRAGGTGLNLTGADVVIHYDPWWNESVQRQATDRAHRIGQKNAVQVYKLITRNSIEEKILKLQEAKATLADYVIHADKNVLVNMSFDELYELFD